jgi:hypothetical protein
VSGCIGLWDSACRQALERVAPDGADPRPQPVRLRG